MLYKKGPFIIDVFVDKAKYTNGQLAWGYRIVLEDGLKPLTAKIYKTNRKSEFLTYSEALDEALKDIKILCDDALNSDLKQMK